MDTTFFIVLALLAGLGVGYWAGRNSLRTLTEHLNFERARSNEFAAQLRSELDTALPRVVADSQEKMLLSTGGKVEDALAPLRERLIEFRTALDQRFGDQQKDVAGLKAEIAAMLAAQGQLRDQTTGLTNALRGNVKVQGQWGEVQLERLLEAAGLQDGRDYHRQGVGLDLKTEDGKRQLPDVVVKLPEKRHVVVDAKVSLLAFERYANSADAAEKSLAEKQFLQSLDAHIKDLSGKNYTQLAGLNSPEIVLLFIPLESAFSLALHLKPELLHEAWQRRVLLVSPTTLFAALRTISSLWQIDKQNKNAAEICRVAGALYDKIATMAEHLDKVTATLAKAESGLEEARKVLTSGRGSAARQLETLKSLGASAQKPMPQRFLADEEPDNTDLTATRDAA
ncbi:MAG: DNA recombination protein RmuC [Holosporales bacterium]